MLRGRPSFPSFHDTFGRQRGKTEDVSDQAMVVVSLRAVLLLVLSMSSNASETPPVCAGLGLFCWVQQFRLKRRIPTTAIILLSHRLHLLLEG